MTRLSKIRGIVETKAMHLPLVNAAARRILRGGASIFMFHRVLPEGESCFEPELVTSTKAFEAFLIWATRTFEILSLDDLLDRREKWMAAKRPLCAMTFDDGWVDNFLHAFPLLQNQGVPATIFLPVNFVGTSRRFWQELLWLCEREVEKTGGSRELIEGVARTFPWFPVQSEALNSYGALKRFLMSRPSEEAEEFTNALIEAAGLSRVPVGRVFVDWDEVHTMVDAGISFGSHSLNHVLLNQMPPAQAVQEIRDSRRVLEDRLGSTCSALAYPWGAANGLAMQAVKQAGYSYAVGTTPGGLAKCTDDRWCLPRIAISDSVVRVQTEFNSDQALASCLKSVLVAATKQPTRRSARRKSNNSRVKIAFVIDQISEWEGGTERQLRALIEILDRDYFDPELCFIFHAPELSGDTLPCRARWICPDPNRVPSAWTRLVRLARVLTDMQPDIVQTFFLEATFAGTIAGRVARVPAVVASRRNAGHWGKFRHKIGLPLISRLPHRWQCNSRAGWEYINKRRWVSPTRLELLPNAIDLAHFTPASDSERHEIRRHLGLSAEGPIFVSVAALTPVKDFQTLLNAAKRLKPALPTAQVLIVGDGPLRKDLEQESAVSGLGQMIRFVGRQSDVRPYLAAADFGVLTSKSEGSSNSVLEYMAMGLPSVLSDIPPNRELVRGLFFAPGNDADLAEKLLSITRDAPLGLQLKREYLAVVSQYSLEKFAVRAQSYYSALASAYA